MQSRRRWRYGFVISGLFLGVAQPVFAQSAFDQLVEASRHEMAKKEGRLSVATEIEDRLVTPVLKAFQKDLPFIRDITYERLNTAEVQHRILLQTMQGRKPNYDVMHVAQELWPDYIKADLFAKPLFEYKRLAKELPRDWAELDVRIIDPEGYFMATAGLARGIVWSPNLVPKGKEPTSWEACLDPMWKGKFLYDPRPKLTGLWYDPKTRESHIQWLKGIVHNGVVLSRQQSANLEKVAAGEFPLFCGVNYHSVMPVIDGGAPLQFAFPDPIPLEFGSVIHVLKYSKAPATTQLLALWLGSKGQEAMDRYAYRGFPWNPKSRKYPLAKGKYVAICDAKCVSGLDSYDKIHAEILKLPGAKAR